MQFQLLCSFLPTPLNPRIKMSFLGMRAWPVPFIKPMWPFIAGGALTFYGVAYAQKAMLQSPEYRDSPKNPHPKPAAAH